MLSYTNGEIDAVSQKGATFVSLEAIKPKALEVIRANDTTGKPVDMIGRVAKRDEGMLIIGNAECQRERSDLLVRKRETLCFGCYAFVHLAKECLNPLC